MKGFTNTVVDALPGHRIDGESPPGRRAEGGGNSLYPCFGLSPGTVFNAASRATPTARRVPRLLPPPARGRAVIGDSPGYRVRGAGTGFQSRVFTLTAERLSPPVAVYRWENRPRGGGADGEGGGGDGSPFPCLNVSLETSPKNLSRWITPPPGRLAPVWGGQAAHPARKTSRDLYHANGCFAVSFCASTSFIFGSPLIARRIAVFVAS